MQTVSVATRVGGGLDLAKIKKTHGDALEGTPHYPDKSFGDNNNNNKNKENKEIDLAGVVLIAKNVGLAQGDKATTAVELQASLGLPHKVCMCMYVCVYP